MNSEVIIKRGHTFNEWIKPTAVNIKNANIEKLKFPAYDFPKLHEIIMDLDKQHREPGSSNREFLGIKLDDFIFIRGLVAKINSELKGTNRNLFEGTTTGNINYETFLLLILRMRNFSRKTQETEFMKIVAVMEEFSKIEQCLIAQYKKGDELYKLLYALDNVFENWLYHLIKHTDATGTYSWNKHMNEYKTILRTELSKFTNNQSHLNICLAITNKSYTKYTETKDKSSRVADFYKTVRNEFMLTCHTIGLNIPIQFKVTFEFIKNLADLICRNKVRSSIDTILNFLESIGFHKRESRLVASLIQFYCKSRDEIESNEIIKLMMAAYRYNQPSKKQETTRSIKNIEKLAIKEKLIPEDVATNEKSLSPKKEEIKVPSPREKKTDMDHYYDDDDEEEKKEKDEEKKKEAELKKSELASKHSGHLTKGVNTLNKGMISKVENYINTNVGDAALASLVIFAFTSLRKGVVLKNWNGFIRSYNYYLRTAIKEKTGVGSAPSGRPPKPIKELLEEGALQPEIRGDILATNTLYVGAGLYAMYGEKIREMIHNLLM